MTDRFHLDLFSGIGGFALAAESVGFETVAFSEIDSYASQILKRHWSTVPNLGDINGYDTWPDYAGVTLCTAGAPCQPASCAGKRGGAEDDRWLWPQTLKVVERYHPAMCLFENPTGLLTLNGGVEFEGVLAGLEALGYAVQAIVVPACAIEALHRRDRVWIMAYSESSDRRRRLRETRTEQNGDQFANCGGPIPDAARERINREHRDHSEARGSGREGIEESYSSGDDVSDANPERLEVGQIEPARGQLPPSERGDSSASDTGRGSGERSGGEVCGGSGATWGQSQPGVGRAFARFSERLDRTPWRGGWEDGTPRLATGIKDRSNRLKCLGNSIVPQVAATILRKMVEPENAV